MIAIDDSVSLVDSVQCQDHFKFSQLEIFGSFVTIQSRSPLLDGWGSWMDTRVGIYQVSRPTTEHAYGDYVGGSPQSLGLARFSQFTNNC